MSDCEKCGKKDVIGTICTECWLKENKKKQEEAKVWDDLKKPKR